MTVRSDLALAAHVDGEPWLRPEEDERELNLTVLPGAGHLSNIEDAAGFNAAALAWLQPRDSRRTYPTRSACYL